MAEEDWHGYGVMKQVQADADGAVKMGPGTQYCAPSQLTQSGPIRRSDSDVDAALNDPRQIYYRLRRVGRDVLPAELEHYRSRVAIGRKRQYSAAPFSAAPLVRAQAGVLEP
ncbi:MAG: PadR family transcriptional regulator [Pseudomonadota bacterium]